MNNEFDLNILISNIENLCGKSNVKSELLKAGVSRNVVENMKKGSTPSIDKIALIANHFNVSIDSLLNNGPMPELLQKSESEWDIILDGLSEESLVQLRDYLKFLHWKQNQAPEDSK